MSFGLSAILIFSLLAIPYSFLLPARWRGWTLLVVSVIAIYWLQPALPIRFSDYILPTATIALTLICWSVTRAEGQAVTRQDTIALGLILALVVGLSFMRFVEADYRLTASRPPEPLAVIITLAVIGAVVAGSQYIVSVPNRRVLTLMILLIVGLFVLFKTEPLAAGLSRLWRGQTGQDVSLASMIDLNWLGFSYVAFRLIHTLRDRQTGQLPALMLREYVTYVIFFPAYTAGPIDRAERFVGDYRAIDADRISEAVAPESGISTGGSQTLPYKHTREGSNGEVVALPPRLRGGRWRVGYASLAPRFTEGATRIMIGLLKKFVIADCLAAGLSLNVANAAQADSTLGLWALTYGYALRLFFDFSGYTDIAIGIAILFGIKLPENFDRPYLKSNITTFWQSWHITLSSWARFYVFSPLSRALLMRKPKPSPILIVLATQMATMLVIGLWHGVTWNFVIWGVWHGAALFVHKLWSDRTRSWYRGLSEKPGQKRAWTLFSWFVTFHYVVIGWVWFALPDTAQAVRVIGLLFGVR